MPLLSSWDFSRLHYSENWELEYDWHNRKISHSDWLKFLLPADMSAWKTNQIECSCQRTVKLQGVSHRKYFLFGIRESSSQPQKSNGKTTQPPMDSTDSADSISLPITSESFGATCGVNTKVISRMRRRDKGVMNMARLTLAETGKNFDALSCRSSEKTPEIEFYNKGCLR